MTVTFFKPQEIKDELVLFAVIMSDYQGKYVFVRHNKRNTLESPGGHRELGETIEACARRELFEETGAIDFQLTFKNIFTTGNGTFGALYKATINSFGDKPDSEIAEVIVSESLPVNWTYPEIQEILLANDY